MTPVIQRIMTSKLSELISLSSRIDDVIEMGAGVMSAEALESLFGKGGGWSKYASSGIAKKAVNPGIVSPILSSASMATGGVAGPSALERLAAARSGANAAISRPIEAGGRGVGAVTGAPPPSSPFQNFMQRNLAPGAAAAPVSSPGLFHGVSGAPQSPGPFASMAASPAGAATTATSSANVAQQVASQAGQNVSAGQSAIQKGKQMFGKAGATGAGLLIGGAMATPDWMTRQSNQSMSAWIDDIIQFADPRPRNPLGEFSGQEGGPDANAMATVYKMPQMQPQGGAGIPKLAGAALVGGALGQIGGNIGKEGWQGMTKLVKHLHKQAKLRK